MTEQVLDTPTSAPARVGLVAAALLVVYVVWGSTYLAIRVVVEQAPPLSGMGTRFVAAGLVLAALLRLRGRSLRVSPRELAGATALGLLLPLGGNGLVAVGQDLGAPSGIAALLVAAVPLWVIVLQRAGGERPRRLTLVGVLLGFLGLAWLVLAGRGAPDGSFSLLAAGLIAAATVFWSFGSFIQPRITLPRDVFVTTVYEMLTGGIAMLAVGVLLGERLTPADYGPRVLAAWAYLVLFGSVLAFTAYVWLLANAPVSLVSTYAYVNPVVAVVLGWLVVAEPITGAVLVGGGVVVASVALVIRSERRIEEHR
jgi:drug/metabolite transporter (DMT)-like permease